MTSSLSRWFLVAMMLVLPARATASDAFFENRIRPLLVQHCIKCHGPKKASSALRLDTFAYARKGGDRGPAIVPDKPDQSLLLTALRHRDDLKMPPKKRLDARAVADVERWIQGGAKWPDGVALGGPGPKLRSGPPTKAERRFWSFRPILDPTPPRIGHPQIRNAIDRFVLTKLAEAKLEPMPPADKRTLLRRVTFDLTGLPPTPDAVDDFLDDDTPTAFEKVVDRLLHSKAYGERWGRHWLDVVRYADTAGETGDYPTPLSYKYRNWVIDAFAEDMPYDKFVRNQLAGDIFAKRSSDPTDYEKRLTATGFIAISRRFGFDVENYHHLTIQDTIDTVGQAFLGLSLGCARCHDHKYDPVDINDYYSWYGIFESTRYSFPGSEEKKRPYDSFPDLPPEQAQLAKANLDAERAKLQAEVNELEAEARSLLGRATGFELQPLDLRPGEPWTAHESARIRKAAQSPYTNALPAGTRGIEFPSGPHNTHFGWKIQPAHTPKTTHRLYFNIDFRNLSVNADSKGAYRFYLGRGPGHSAAVEMAANATTFFIKDGGPYRSVRELELGKWYNVQLVLDLKSKTYSGYVGQPGNLTRFAGKAFTNGWDGTIDRFFVDRYAHIGGDTPARQLDNVVIQTTKIAPLDAKSQSKPTAPFGDPTKLETLLVRLDNAKRRLADKQKATPYGLIYGAIEKDKPADAEIRIRGNRRDLGATVQRRNLALLGGEFVQKDAGSGRLQMANWITSPSNPLTARVMVNRIWQHHFGRGLVATENDFGTRGTPPTHPELLDWLASRFIESGYSVKAMHRLILSSATYQRSSKHNARAMRTDPDARWLWRFPRRRASAEEIRDAMLFVSGDLDTGVGGEHPFPPQSSWGFTQHNPYYGVYPTNKRSVYLMQQRLKRHPFLALFDGADPNVSTARRNLTTVPTQSLYLMNNPFVHDRSKSLAKRIIASESSSDARLDVAWRITLARTPSESERSQAQDFLRRYGEALAKTPTPKAERELALWSALARGLLTRNEFLYID